MLLSARILTGVASVNVFTYTDSARFTEGDTVDLYFQLVDMEVERDAYQAKGRRYIPADEATPVVSVSFGSIDNAKKIARTAIQPFAGDSSIWKVSFLATDVVRGTMDMRITLTETISINPDVTRVTRGVVRQAISVEAQNTSF